MGALQYVVLVLILFLYQKCQALTGDIEYDGRLNIRLEHALDNSPTPQFIHRGDISIKSLHSGTTFLEQIQLTTQQIKSLKQLAKKDGNYRLRATVRTLDDKQTSFLTFVKACSLVESKLTDWLSVNLDHVGNVVAVSVASPVICSGLQVDDEYLMNFNTSVFIRHMELGPIPDTASYIQKLEKEREAKERGESKDNRSFLGKYWMYIVPVVIFILLSSATNPEAAGGGQR